jgi:Cdc6-like AAA superfamily ATPase
MVQLLLLLAQPLPSAARTLITDLCRRPHLSLLCLQVLYQLFDWPSQPGSRLAIIGISNTHDLDQLVLPRIASRLDQAKLAFAPYSAAQLTAIVQDRLQGSGVKGAVDEVSVQMACRKVAAETGARNVSEWCKMF